MNKTKRVLIITLFLDRLTKCLVMGSVLLSIGARERCTISRGSKLRVILYTKSYNLVQFQESQSIHCRRVGGCRRGATRIAKSYGGSSFFSSQGTTGSSRLDNFMEEPPKGLRNNQDL